MPHQSIRSYEVLLHAALGDRRETLGLRVPKSQLVNHQGQHKKQNGETTMANVLTLEEVASYLRVHPSTIYRLLKKKRLPAFKVGSDWRFNVESIDRWRAEAEDSEPEMKIREV